MSIADASLSQEGLKIQTNSSSSIPPVQVWEMLSIRQQQAFLCTLTQICCAISQAVGNMGQANDVQ